MNAKDKKYEEPLSLNMGFLEALTRFTKVNIKDLKNTTKQTQLPLEKATPFVKWVGGKRSIINELLARIPSQINDYYEGFVGGGALFYEIQEKATNCYLSDINFDLIITYNVIKKDLDSLIELLQEHKNKHNDTYYYKMRSNHELQNPIEIAARFIYLNKTCFNGLYRVNKKGEFNVPVGKYVNPCILQERNLRNVSKVLQKAKIRLMEFDKIMPKQGDFVYFDPPYHSKNSNSFTTYTKSDFGEKDQIRLRDFALELTKNGVNVMLSNSNVKFIRDIYGSKHFNINIVNAPRNVNCKPNKRGAVEEVLITNY